jgi:Domain of unknown function (DUF5979)
MLRRFASVVAGGALAITSYSVVAAVPAAAWERFPNTIEVTKVVVGEHRGVGYQVVVECQQEENGGIGLFNGDGFSETLTFPPEGGTQEVGAPSGATCTIVETHDGGATHVTVEPDTCEFPEGDKMVPVPAGPGAGASLDNHLDNHEGETCEVTVTNTFEEEEPVVGPAGPPGPPGPPGEAAPAAAVTARARFTG